MPPSRPADRTQHFGQTLRLLGACTDGLRAPLLRTGIGIYKWGRRDLIKIGVFSMKKLLPLVFVHVAALAVFTQVTPNLRLNTPAPGMQPDSWGALFNKNMSILDAAVGSVKYVGEGITQWGTGDVGSQINNAITAFPKTGGRVHVQSRSTCYEMSTPVVLTTPIVIEGDPGGATCLHWARTSGQAITLNWGGGSPHIFYGAGVRDLTLTGPCATTACVGVTSLGISITAEGAFLQNVNVGSSGAGFQTGIQFGSTGFLATIVNARLYYNNLGVGQLASANGEGNHFFGGSISADAAALTLKGNGDFYFSGVDFDDNTNTNAINITGTQGITVGFTDCHWENPSRGPATYFNITAPAFVYLRGGVLNDDRRSGTNPGFIAVDGGNYINVEGTVLYSAGITVTQVVSIAALKTLYIKTLNLVPTRIPADFTSGFTGNLVDLYMSAGGTLSGSYFSNGNNIGITWQGNQGAILTSGNVTLGKGWGTSASVTAPSGFSNTFQFTINSGSASFTAAPTVTVTLPNVLVKGARGSVGVCTLDVHGITGSGGLILLNETTPSLTAPVFTPSTSTGSAFTPAAGETYTVVGRCGP